MLWCRHRATRLCVAATRTLAQASGDEEVFEGRRWMCSLLCGWASASGEQCGLLQALGHTWRMRGSYTHAGRGVQGRGSVRGQALDVQLTLCLGKCIRGSVWIAAGIGPRDCAWRPHARWQRRLEVR